MCKVLLFSFSYLKFLNNNQSSPPLRVLVFMGLGLRVFNHDFTSYRCSLLTEDLRRRKEIGFWGRNNRHDTYKLVLDYLPMGFIS